MAEILLSIPKGYAGVSKVVHQLTSHCSQNTVAAVLVALASGAQRASWTSTTHVPDPSGTVAAAAAGMAASAAAATKAALPPLPLLAGWDKVVAEEAEYFWYVREYPACFPAGQQSVPSTLFSPGFTAFGGCSWKLQLQLHRSSGTLGLYLSMDPPPPVPGQWFAPAVGAVSPFRAKFKVQILRQVSSHLHLSIAPERCNHHLKIADM